MILTAEFDVLRDEGEAYAARLVADGVSVVHQRFEGQMHGFFTMVGLLPGSDAAIDCMALHIRQTRPAQASGTHGPAFKAGDGVGAPGSGTSIPG